MRISTHKVSRNNAVHELQQSHSNKEQQEGIQQLHALVRLVHVVVPDSDADLVQVLPVAHMAAVAGGRLVGRAGRLARGGGDGGCWFGGAGRDGGGGGSG